jgi:hypothetical protein
MHSSTLLLIGSRENILKGNFLQQLINFPDKERLIKKDSRKIVTKKFLKFVQENPNHEKTKIELIKIATS